MAATTPAAADIITAIDEPAGQHVGDLVSYADAHLVGDRVTLQPVAEWTAEGDCRGAGWVSRKKPSD